MFPGEAEDGASVGTRNPPDKQHNGEEGFSEEEPECVVSDGKEESLDHTSITK